MTKAYARRRSADAYLGGFGETTVATRYSRQPTEGFMRHKGSSAFVVASIAAAAFAGSGTASAPTGAACIGQFFSSHAGSGAEGVTVGGFVAPTAQELRGEFGQTIAGGRELPREECGL